MSGALIELISKGAQDVYITDTQGVSFFKIKYQRYTNFTQAPKKLAFVGQIPANNSTSVIKIERLGDLINNVWLEGPSIVTRLPGTVFDLYIGGQKVDSQTFDFMNDIWQIYMAETYAKSTNVNISTNTFFPLHFFFCDNEMFLPLVALQYVEVEIRIMWGSLISTGSVICCANYVYLDTTERETMVSKDMDLLVTQVQRYTYPLKTGTVDMDLSFLNHPVKSLFFGFEKEDLYVPTDSFTFSDADLQLNGTYLFENMSPMYFHTVQCYYRTKFGVNGYNVQAGAPTFTRYFSYNFCIDASSYRPTGTCNFSRLDNAKLTLKNVTIAASRVGDDIKVYAVNYNVIRIKKGIAGILFSN